MNIMSCTSAVIDSGGKLCNTDRRCDPDQSIAWATQISSGGSPDPIDEETDGVVCGSTSGSASCDCLCPSASQVEDQCSTGTTNLFTSTQLPTAAMEIDSGAACGSIDPQCTSEVAPEFLHAYSDAGGTSSSHASVMQSDDENVTVGQIHSSKVAVRDLEAGLYIDNFSCMDEEEKNDLGMCKDANNSDPVEATHEDKEVLLNGESKLGAEFLEKEAEVHGLRKRRGAKVDAIRASAIADSGLGRMPEEDRRNAVIATRLKDVPLGSGSDAKYKAVEKKSGKQGKGTVKPAGRRASETPPLSTEDLRQAAKDDADSRKVHESLDNFIRQTIRCEPYMTFPGRPGDKQTISGRRSELDHNPVARGYTGKSLKVDGGSDARDIRTEDNLGLDSRSSDVDGLKDTPISASKGIGGLGRGPQHSLKVPPGVVAFTQAAAKGTDLPGWPLLSPSKMTLTKCEKCVREFCSSLNYRRHVRVHRKSLTEKKDLSKERSKVAEFWDKLTPDQASDIVNYENMEIEELSGNSLLKALTSFIQQPGMPSMPQGLMKAGSALLDIVQNKPSAYPLSSERLLGILDDASERTFLSGGTSVAYQHVVFNGDARKVGLEEKNLVASIGFHVELRLVKAWMADKEAEALRNQQALFKEEEAAQQKRAKLLEKRRMKKIRQKERKVTASQLIQELENESFDDEGNMIPGVQEDDSPTATGSSASSLVSAHDLPLQGTSDVDMNEDPVQVEGRDELGLGLGLEGELSSERNKAREEDNVQLSRDLFSTSGLTKSMFYNPDDLSESFVSINRKGEYNSFELTGGDKGSNWSSRHIDEASQDIDRDARMANPVSYNRSGRSADVHTSSQSRKVDQEKVTADYRRRDTDRSAVERKSLRTNRDSRSRNDCSESFQKTGRDTRGYDTRYVDGASQPSFKPVRKANSFCMKSDAGTSDLSTLSRSQQYRNKPSGMHRTLPITGNGQVVWTRKVPQPVVLSLTKDKGGDISQDDPLASKPLCTEGWDAKVESTGVLESARDSIEGPHPRKLEKDDAEEEEILANPNPVEVKIANEPNLAGHSDDTTFVFGNKGLEPQDEALFSGALLVGSLSVPIGKFATDSVFQSRIYPMFNFPSDEAPLLTSSQTRNVEENNGTPHPIVEGVDRSCSQCASLNTGETSNGLSENAGSVLTISIARPIASLDQTGKVKQHSPTSESEKGEGGRGVAFPTGNDRLAIKQGSWQTPAGRYVTAKVWRAVGVVGDKQDLGPGSVVSGGDCEGSTFQDEMDIMDRSETDKLLVQKGSERQANEDNVSVVLHSTLGENSNHRSSSYTGVFDTATSVGCEADTSLNGAAECSSSPGKDDGAETAILVSGLCSLSVFLEVAERFLSERWRAAVSHASAADYVDCSAEGISKAAEGCNVSELLSQELSVQGTRHHSGADSLPCSSSSVLTHPLGKTALVEGVLLSRIHNDSDQTGMEDVRRDTTNDDQRLDGADSEEFDMPQALSLEEDAGMRDSLSSPVDCEHYSSGIENFRNYTASTAPVGRVHESDRHPESRGGGGGSLGYSYARQSSSRQERWYRNPRDRFPEQRYMPRRRAPVEKNC